MAEPTTLELIRKNWQLNLVVMLALVVPSVLAVTYKFWRPLLPHGATAADLASARLDVMAGTLEDELPASEVEDGDIETHLRHDVAEFEAAKFIFDRDGARHVTGMRLIREQDKEGKARKSGHGDELEQRFAMRFPSADGGRLRRPRVDFWLTTKELGFDVAVKGLVVDSRVDVARDVLLSIAFGGPCKHSDQEIADTLGTGYPIADVARTLPTFEAMMTQFPGSTYEPSHVFGVRERLIVPLTHPLVDSVELSWDEHRLHVSFNTTGELEAQGPDAFAACIAKQPASSLLTVTNERLTTVGNETDPKAFASLLQAVKVCPEQRGQRRFGR